MKEYMEEAYKESLKALRKKEIPVGAVIIKDQKIIAKAHNLRQKKHNILGHAEILCINKAEKKLKDWRLNGCEMYVTMKPCKMCEEIIKESRLEKVYYLSESNYKKYRLQYKIEKINDMDELNNNYTKYLKNFFKSMRKKLK